MPSKQVLDNVDASIKQEFPLKMIEDKLGLKKKSHLN